MTDKEYFCLNCRNFKKRTIKREDLGLAEDKKIEKLLKARDFNSLPYDFPVNLCVYKRVMRLGSCEILYCKADMFDRKVYIARDNEGSIKPPVAPCPKYV